jgi:hypothetical protein
MSDCVLDSSLLYGLILAEAHAMGSVLAPPRLGFASERYGICTHSQIAAISVRSTLNAHGADRCSPLRRPHVTRHAARFSRCREGTVAPHIHSPLPHQYTPGHPPNLDCRTITTSIAPPIHTWPPSKPRLPHHHHHHLDCRTERTSFLTSTSTRGWLHPEMVAQGFAFPGMPELLTSCRSALKNSSSWRTWGTSSLLLAPSPAVERGNRCDNPSCSRRPACSARRRGARIRHT